MYAQASAIGNPLYTMNEAYTSNEKDNEMECVEAPVNQDVRRLTENIY